MVAKKELYLKITRGIWGRPERYEMNEDVTVLTEKDCVIRGIITSINDNDFVVTDKRGKNINISYENMKNIANTDWLGGEDIRD